MNTDLSFGIFTVIGVIYYLALMRVGLRTGPSTKWPLSSEATLATGVLLISQWLFLCLWLWALPSEHDKILVGQLAFPGLLLIPGILLLIWGWIYLKRNK
jgi:hypothetical protein